MFSFLEQLLLKDNQIQLRVQLSNRMKRHQPARAAKHHVQPDGARAQQGKRLDDGAQPSKRQKTLASVLFEFQPDSLERAGNCFHRRIEELQEDYEEFISICNATSGSASPER